MSFESVITPSRCLCPTVSSHVEYYIFFFFSRLSSFLSNITLRSSRMSTSIVDLDLYDVRVCALAFDVGNSPFKKSSSSLFIPSLVKKEDKVVSGEREVGVIYLRNCESRECVRARVTRRNRSEKGWKCPALIGSTIRTC